MNWYNIEETNRYDRDERLDEADKERLAREIEENKNEDKGLRTPFFMFMRALMYMKLNLGA
jgi:hypothetical protein